MQKKHYQKVTTITVKNVRNGKRQFPFPSSKKKEKINKKPKRGKRKEKFRQGRDAGCLGWQVHQAIFRQLFQSCTSDPLTNSLEWIALGDGPQIPHLCHIKEAVSTGLPPTNSALCFSQASLAQTHNGDRGLIGADHFTLSNAYVYLNS